MFTNSWWPSQPLTSSIAPIVVVMIADVPYDINDISRGMDATLAEAIDILASEDEGMVVA